MSPITFTGLTKKFIWIFPYHLMQKPEWTFWPTQCFVVTIDFIIWFSLKAITFERQGDLSVVTVAFFRHSGSAWYIYIGATCQAGIISRLAMVYRSLKF